MIKKLLLLVHAMALCLAAVADDYSLQTRAEHGDAAAQYDLGWYYEKSLSSPDVEKAWYWWSKSANNGSLDANHLLGHVYRVGFLQYNKNVENGETTVVKHNIPALPAGGDISMAIYYYKRCAMSDAFGDAQYWLGKWYYEGKVVTRDYVQAFRYISRAAANDGLDKDMRIEMMRKLAMCYRNGQGTEVDAAMADKWIKEADLLKNGCYALLYDELGMPYEPNDIFEIFFVHKKSDEGHEKVKQFGVWVDSDGSGRFKLDCSLVGEVLVLDGLVGYERIEFKFEPGVKLYLKRKE